MAIALGGSGSAFGGIIASTGFDSPIYADNRSIVGQGGGESGWATTWSGYGNETGAMSIIQSDVFQAGDQALRITHTDNALRRLAVAQAGQFVVDQFVRFTEGARMFSPVFDSTQGLPPQQLARETGPQWIALEDGRILTLDGDGNGGGTQYDTGFRYTPDTWHRVTLVIDVPSESYEFYFDWKRFNSPTPLGFRGVVTTLDSIHYVAEVSGVSYVDSLVVSTSMIPEPSTMMLSGLGFLGSMVILRVKRNRTVVN